MQKNNSSSRNSSSLRANKSVRKNRSESRPHEIKFDRFGRQIKNDKIVGTYKPEDKSEKRSFLSKRKVSKPKTVYIGNLNYNIDEKGLLGIFSKFGKVKAINIIRDAKTDVSKGIAFIEMVKAEEADSAIKELDGKLIDRRTVKVSEAIENGAYKSSPSDFKRSNSPKAAAKSLKQAEEEKIIIKKKNRRTRGLDELFVNTGRK